MHPLPIADFVESLLTALFLGAVIGFERQWRNSAAGLRTNTLVAVGSALFVLFGPLSGVNGDVRLTAQIISGIGFIGGGAILREGLTIRGVNTAATLWCSAAIGSLCGTGFLAQAAIATIVILSANLILRPISHKMMAGTLAMSDLQTEYRFQFTCGPQNESRLRKLLVSEVSETDILIRSIASETQELTNSLVVKSILMSPKKNDHLVERVVEAFTCDPEANNVSWEIVGQKGLHE